jgi:hypothetical protein
MNEPFESILLLIPENGLTIRGAWEITVLGSASRRRALMGLTESRIL